MVGVLFTIRDCIHSKLLPSPDKSKVITVQLCAPKPVVLCTAYLSPHSTLADAQPLFDHLSSVCSGTMPVITIDDHNLPGIDWQTLSDDSLISNTFCDLIFDLNLTQLMGSPSHISGNILDLLLTNNEDLIQNITVHPYEASPIPTDHLMISFQLSLGICLSNKTHSHVIHDYSKDDFKGMTNYILNSDTFKCSEIYINVAWTFI